MVAKSLGPKAITNIMNLGTTFTCIREGKRLLFVQCTALQFVMGFNHKDNKCHNINSKKDMLCNRETVTQIAPVFAGTKLSKKTPMHKINTLKLSFLFELQS